MFLLSINTNNIAKYKYNYINYILIQLYEIISALSRQNRTCVFFAKNFQLVKKWKKMLQNWIWTKSVCNSHLINFGSPITRNVWTFKTFSLKCFSSPITIFFDVGETTLTYSNATFFNSNIMCTVKISNQIIKSVHAQLVDNRFCNITLNVHCLPVIGVTMWKWYLFKDRDDVK